MRQFVFDAYGRLRTENWLNASSQVIEHLDFTYDVDDQILSADETTNATLRKTGTSYTYNDPIRRQSSSLSINTRNPNTPVGQPKNLFLTNLYNTADELMSTTVTGVSTADYYSLNYLYSSLGQLFSVNQSPPAGGTSTASSLGAWFNYNPAGQLTQSTYFNHFSAPGQPQFPSKRGLTANYYDQAGRQVKLENYFQFGQIADRLQFSFDADNRIVSKSIEWFGGAAGSRNVRLPV